MNDTKKASAAVAPWASSASSWESPSAKTSTDGSGCPAPAGPPLLSGSAEPPGAARGTAALAGRGRRASGSNPRPAGAALLPEESAAALPRPCGAMPGAAAAAEEVDAAAPPAAAAGATTPSPLHGRAGGRRGGSMCGALRTRWRYQCQLKLTVGQPADRRQPRHLHRDAKSDEYSHSSLYYIY